MMQLESDSMWIKRGRQKSAVACVLRRPMTPSEIWRAAQALNSRIQLRDVWLILGQCQRRGLVRCRSPRAHNGKIYYWTDSGRAVVAATFGIANPLPPTGISWTKFSAVARSKLRRLVLRELAHARFPGDRAKTATRVRQGLRETDSVGLNGVIRALQELTVLKLVAVVGEGEKRGQKLYRLTSSGRRIARLLTDRSDSPQTLLNPGASLSP